MSSYAGVVLPQSVGGSASGWQLVDYLEVARQTPPAVGGLAELLLPQLADDVRWLIDHAVVSCDSTLQTQLRWYDSTPEPLSQLDGSFTGNYDVSEWPNGLRIAPGRALLMQWTGCSPKARGTVNLQARVLRRAG